VGWYSTHHFITCYDSCTCEIKQHSPPSLVTPSPSISIPSNIVSPSNTVDSHCLPSIIHPNQLCERCLVGKKFLKSFLKESISKACQPQKIHVDVCSLIKPCLFGKNLYFLLFIDYYSRKTWVYLWKEKSNMFSCFKKFKALVEKEVIILYNHSGQIGSEFCSNYFNVFCEDHGIKRLLTVPRSP
jgi:hypothetical protein